MRGASETVHYDLSLRATHCSAIFVDAAGARDVAFEFLEEVGKEKNIKEVEGSKPRSSFCFGSATNI